MVEQEGSLVEMTSRTKFWALSAGALAISLALAGCGGGGSSGSPSTASNGGGAPAPAPAPVVTSVSLAGLTPGYDLPDGTLEIDAGASMDSSDVTFACAADGEDCTVTVADGIATSTGGMVTASDSAAHVAAVAELTKIAGTVEIAIAAEAAQTMGVNPMDDGPGGMDAATDHMIVITRDRAGMMVKVSVVGAKDGDPEFMDFDRDLGSAGSAQSRKKEADDDGSVSEERIFVYSDIEAPVATPFAEVEGQMLNARDLDDMTDEDGDGDAENDFTALAIDGSVLALVASSAFTANGMLDFSADDPATADIDEASEVVGTYNGAMGTYRCNGKSDCTVQVAVGEIAKMNGDWVFTPDAGATSDVADSDYLHYGFWTKLTTAADGAITVEEVETFAGSSIPATEGDITSVEGTATYKGGAAGGYEMKHDYDSVTGKPARATVGNFEADVSLMATFGGGSVPEDDHFSFTGTIDNFRLSLDGDSDWSVALKGYIDKKTGDLYDSKAEGGVGDGSFHGTFYGPATMTADDGTITNIAPHSIAGEFNAGFDNGSVVGAYGARKQ